MSNVDEPPNGFQPAFWLRGGHRQTLLGYALRRFGRWRLPAQDLVVAVDADVRLLVRVTWQPGRLEERPALVIVHGLGGSDSSSYVIAAGRLAHARGWHVARMNMRGCGASEALCPELYDAGLDGDVLAVVRALARHTPRAAVLGFSLGGNMALLGLGRRAAELPAALAAVAAVSPPLDLAGCSAALEHPRNRLYQEHFVRMLRDGYLRRRRRRPDRYPEGLERGSRTVRAFDDRVTAPFGGYAGVGDYYARSSAGPWLSRVERPALILTAADDPLIPVSTVNGWPLSPAVRREITATGGHVGFVGGSGAPGWFWAAERSLRFLEGATA